ncbi:MAG: type II toxin-antitoxin system VapB family antitoxin [Acidimicrobiia bacterium]
MADLLIRDIPEHVLAAIDARAKKLGLSRSEYLRRQLSSEVAPAKVKVADLERLAGVFADLDDPAVMRDAWD